MHSSVSSMAIILELMCDKTKLEPHLAYITYAHTLVVESMVMGKILSFLVVHPEG